MNTISRNKSGNDLQHGRRLADVAQTRAKDVGQYDRAERVVSSDDEADSECPIFESFYNTGGSTAILNMTNFTCREFGRLYDRFRCAIVQACRKELW